MTTETKTRTVTLTDRAPVRITEDQWPVIASGAFTWYDNQFRFQANRTCDIFVKVRQHADKRHLIYAGYDTSSAWQGEQDERQRTGELIDAGQDVIESLKRVMHDLAERAGDREKEIRGCLNECIAELPAVEL